MREDFRYWIGVWAMLFLGVLFIVAGLGKLLAGINGFEPFTALAFLPHSLLDGISMGLPYIEIAIGVLLLLGIAVKFANSCAAFLITGFIVSNLLAIYFGRGAEPCAGCFGVYGSLTAISALLLDGIMAALVVTIAFCYRGSFFDMSPLVLKKARV